MTRSTNHVEVLRRMRNEWPLATDEGPALDAAIASLSAQQPAGAAKDAEIESLRAELDRVLGEHVRKIRELAASRSRADRLAGALREVTAVAITVLYATHREETLAEFSTAELEQAVDVSEKMWEQRVEHIYRRAWDTALRDHDQEVGNG